MSKTMTPLADEPRCIRETAAHGAFVTTEKLCRRYLRHPYRTAVVDKSGAETCVGFFHTKAAALHAHEWMVRAVAPPAS